MITDKLLAFADGKAITVTANSDVVDIGKSGDEIARTLNLVAQFDNADAVTPTTATVTPKLQGSEDGSTWVDIVAFPAITVADAIENGGRFINFAKLPIGGLKAKMRLNITVGSGPLVSTTYSAWLTPSVDTPHYA